MKLLRLSLHSGCAALALRTPDLGEMGKPASQTSKQKLENTAAGYRLGRPGVPAVRDFTSRRPRASSLTCVPPPLCLQSRGVTGTPPSASSQQRAWSLLSTPKRCALLLTSQSPVAEQLKPGWPAGLGSARRRLARHVPGWGCPGPRIRDLTGTGEGPSTKTSAASQWGWKQTA